MSSIYSSVPIHYFSPKTGLTTIKSISVTICTAKIPTTAATKSMEASFIANIMGIASTIYRVKIEANPIKVDLERDCPKVIGMVLPIRRKLIILKHAPIKSPLAIAFSLTNIRKTAKSMADVMVQKHILLCIRPSSSCCSGILCALFFILFGGFHDLSVYGIATANYSQQNKNGNKKPPGIKPLVQIIANGKTKQDRARHSQTKLRDQGDILNPFPLLLKVENSRLSTSVKNNIHKD